MNFSISIDFVSELRTLNGHGDPVTCVAFDATCVLASCSGGSTIKLWNKNTGDLLRTLSSHDDGYWVYSVAFDATYLLASGSRDSTIKLWNKNTGDLLRTLSGHGDAVMSVAFSPKREGTKT